MTHHIARPAPWLVAAVDQKLALLTTLGASSRRLKQQGFTTVMLQLTEPADGASEAEIKRWDTRCDNCGKEGHPGFNTGHLSYTWDGVELVIALGVCGDCMMEEP